MALQGKITANRGYQSAGTSQKVIVARNMSLTAGQSLSALTDVDTTQRNDGSMVIWDSNSSTFKVQGELEHAGLQIIGGSF